MNLLTALDVIFLCILCVMTLADDPGGGGCQLKGQGLDYELKECDWRDMADVSKEHKDVFSSCVWIDIILSKCH